MPGYVEIKIVKTPAAGFVWNRFGKINGFPKSGNRLATCREWNNKKKAFFFLN